MACQGGVLCINAILPRELLVGIASLLDEGSYDKTNLSSSSQVCKLWRSIGREGLRSLRISCTNLGEDAEEQLTRCLNLFPYLDRLHLVLDDEDPKQAVEVHEKVLNFVHNSSVRVKHLEFSFYTLAYHPWPAPRAMKLPDFLCEWEWLESLALCGDLILRGLSESGAARWSRLKNLTLSRCDDLHLASKQWTSLQHLHIHNLESESLPADIENWQKLKVFVLGSRYHYRDICPNLQQLSPSVESWSQLEILKLHGLSKLESLPPEVSAWSGLRELSLSSCSSLTGLPCQVEAWRSLQTVELKSCDLLYGLPVEVKGWMGLRVLTISYCPSFWDFSEGVRGWTSLQETMLQNCDALIRLPEQVDGWSNLRRILIDSCHRKYFRNASTNGACSRSWPSFIAAICAPFLLE